MDHLEETMTKRFISLSGLAVLFAVAGCGGGGGATIGGGGVGSGRLAMFATDNMNANYESVWVKIYKIDLVGSAGTVNGFSDPAGKIIDLKTLRDATGARFSFLSETTIPAGTYTKTSVQMDKALRIVKTGAANAEDRQFAAAFDDPSAAGKTVAGFEFSAPKSLGTSSDDFVVDFDLSKWNDDGTFVTPVVTDGTHSGVDDVNRQEDEDFKGNISSFAGTSPNFTFDLRGSHDQLLKVTTDAGTAIFNGNGAANPVLSNGVSVEIRGVFDTVSNTFEATSIKIENGGGGGDDSAQAQGAPKNIDAVAKTFSVDASEGEGFIPAATLVPVTVSASTKFFSHGGVVLTTDAFFTALATAPIVEVDGTYDAATNTIVASKCKLDSGEHGGGGGNHGGSVDVRGVPGSFNAATGTIQVNIDEYEGFIPPTPGKADIVVTGTTEIKGASGTMTKEAFFAGLTNSTQLKVEGSFENRVITATEIKVGSGGGGGGNGGNNGGGNGGENGGNNGGNGG